MSFFYYELLSNCVKFLVDKLILISVLYPSHCIRQQFVRDILFHGWSLRERRDISKLLPKVTQNCMMMF